MSRLQIYKNLYEYMMLLQRYKRKVFQGRKHLKTDVWHEMWPWPTFLQRAIIADDPRVMPTRLISTILRLALPSFGLILPPQPHAAPLALQFRHQRFAHNLVTSSSAETESPWLPHANSSFVLSCLWKIWSAVYLTPWLVKTAKYIAHLVGWIWSQSSVCLT